MIDHINRTRARHIVTLEDPIEYLHADKRSIVNQREVGSDTESFGRAMRRVLRQDPDVILIGEMRDEETVRTALSAAETGHLVLSTVHTLDATETINRIIDFFPPHLQQQARVMLAATLKGAIAQRLVPDVTGEGRVAASEVMVVTGRVQDLILNPEETGKITEVIAEGEYYGMQTFDQSLLALRDGGQDHRGGRARLRLQPARLQADAGRAAASGRAASSSSSEEPVAPMREKLNENPMAQVGLVAVLVVARGSSCSSNRRRRRSRRSRTDRSDGHRRRHRSTACTAHAAPAPAKRSKAPSPSAGIRAAARRRPARCRARCPRRRRRAAVAHAYEAGKTVVLLVVHDGGIDDELVAAAAGQLAGIPTSPSSSSPARSRSPAMRAITARRSTCNRVPALVVMRPRR